MDNSMNNNKKAYHDKKCKVSKECKEWVKNINKCIETCKTNDECYKICDINIFCNNKK